MYERAVLIRFLEEEDRGFHLVANSLFSRSCKQKAALTPSNSVSTHNPKPYHRPKNLGSHYIPITHISSSLLEPIGQRISWQLIPRPAMLGLGRVKTQSYLARNYM